MESTFLYFSVQVGVTMDFPSTASIMRRNVPLKRSTMACECDLPS